MNTVLFDLDGTLHDRNATLRAWLPGHQQRFDLPEEYAPRFLHLDDYGYRSKRDFLPQLVQEFQLDCAAQALLDDYDLCLNHARPMLHAPAVLRELRRRGVRIGVVTNGWREAQTRCLHTCGLTDLVDDVVISKVVGLSKPDPAIYHLALQRLGADIRDTWFVGDSPRNDIHGPQQIGLRAAYLPTGHALGRERPDAVLTDLRGVLHLP